jgi:Flp pilus assembly protein TadG
MMRSMWRRLKDDEGANLVEAAVILPVVMWVLFAGFEFSGILYAQMALQNGVTLATRFAVTRVVLAGKSRTDSIKSVLKTDTPSLTIVDSAITFSHMDAGSSTWTAGTGSANSIEKVSVTYTWPIMTPFMSYIFGSNTITLYAVSAMKNESDPGT